MLWTFLYNFMYQNGMFHLNIWKISWVPSIWGYLLKFVWAKVLTRALIFTCCPNCTVAMIQWYLVAPTKAIQGLVYKSLGLTKHWEHFFYENCLFTSDHYVLSIFNWWSLGMRYFHQRKIFQNTDVHFLISVTCGKNTNLKKLQGMLLRRKVKTHTAVNKESFRRIFWI